MNGVRWAYRGWLPLPMAVVRAGREVPVTAVLDRWVEAGAWWEGEEGETVHFRVELRDGTVLQLVHGPHRGAPGEGG